MHSCLVNTQSRVGARMMDQPLMTWMSITRGFPLIRRQGVDRGAPFSLLPLALCGLDPQFSLAGAHPGQVVGVLLERRSVLPQAAIDPAPRRWTAQGARPGIGRRPCVRPGEGLRQPLDRWDGDAPRSRGLGRRRQPHGQIFLDSDSF